MDKTREKVSMQVRLKSEEVNEFVDKEEIPEMLTEEQILGLI
jgi:hypothetical protein